MTLRARYYLRVIIFCFAQVHAGLMAQSDQPSIPKPTFETFTGTVYDMPVIRHRLGKLIKVGGIQEFYSDTIYSYDSIQSISLDKINITSRLIDRAGFPGIEKRTKFAMMLHSKMMIEQAGCYEFSLSSDDGSRLWINEEQIINNDGGHGMRTRMDSTYLNSGTYDIKLWYFQGLPNQLGFIFDSKYVLDDSGCDALIEESKIIDKLIVISKRTIDAVLFETDQYKLSDEAKAEILKVADHINGANVSQVSVIGHTDSVGTSAYNDSLSQKRAEHVLALLQQHVTDTSISYLAIGRGAN